MTTSTKRNEGQKEGQLEEINQLLSQISVLAEKIDILKKEAGDPSTENNRKEETKNERSPYKEENAQKYKRSYEKFMGEFTGMRNLEFENLKGKWPKYLGINTKNDMNIKNPSFFG